MSAELTKEQCIELAQQRLHCGMPVNTFKQELEDCFDGITAEDIALIDEIYYFDGWVSYEESGGFLIFKGIDGSLQIAHYGYCVMDSNHDNPFKPNDISYACAVEEIAEMLHYCSDPNNWPEY